MNVIHTGDCLEQMRRIPDESIGIVVTSPPYNIRKMITQGSKWANSKLVNEGYDDYGDDMDKAEYVDWQRECLREMMRVIQPDGAIFYNHKWRVRKGLLLDNREILDGFPVRQIIIWHRSGAIHKGRLNFMQDYEVIYLIAKPEFRLLPGESRIGAVWRIDQERKNPHPAPFPVSVPLNCIRAAGKSPVLDPFGGSGTTAVAAKMLGFDWVLIERNPDYVAMAEKRIAETQVGLL